MVVENLRARPARTGVAHGPEIVGTGDADDRGFGDAGDLAPQSRRLVVVFIDGDHEALLVEGEVAGEQPPSEQDGALLEIVAEGEIAEHLEEGVVAGGVADIVEVVVLTASAHAFLRRRRAQEGGLLLAGEHVLERHHAGIGEHQRRIVARHQRARGHHLVIVLGKEVEESRTDIVGAGVAHAGVAHTCVANTCVVSACRRRIFRLGACFPGTRVLGARGFHTRGFGGGHGSVMGDLSFAGTGARYDPSRFEPEPSAIDLLRDTTRRLTVRRQT